ncbi:MAG: YceI family protein [Flavobacteriales bacterium]|nr:YceI family protein [Flavobacteriales bacterium]
MKGIKFFTGLAALGLAASISLHAVAGEKYAVAKGTTVKWLGKKVTGEHYGVISIKSGEFTMDKGRLTGGTFTIDMNSIVCNDMEGEYKGKLEGHLKSDDFFGVAKYPAAVMVIKNVEEISGNKMNVKADMTIKGVTTPVEFPVTITSINDKVSTNGTITIDRTKHGIKYGSGSFFDDLGDKMIDDNFTISFDFLAAKKG